MKIDAQLASEGLELLKELIRIPSTSPGGEAYWEVASLLKEFLEARGVKAEVVRVPSDYQEAKCKSASRNPRYVVRASVGEGRPWLQLNGHYDVVPGGPGWTKTKPFEPLVEGDLVYGRGATDMKGGLTSMALALALYSRGGEEKPALLDAVFVPDEEIGGECGTGYVVESLGSSLPDYVVIAEPSTSKYIMVGHRGGIWAKVTVAGKTAHASTPWMGVNAFVDMARLVVWLSENYVKSLEGVRSSYEYDVPGAEKPTAMIGGEGGVPEGKANQVPGEAFFTIDRRLVVEEDLGEVERELESAVLEASARLGIDKSRVKLQVMHKIPPAFVKPGNDLSLAIFRAAEAAGLPKPKEVVSAGGLDLHYYTSRGVTAVAYGPGVLKLSHSPNEYVDFKDVLKFAEVYARLPFELAGPGHGRK